MHNLFIVRSPLQFINALEAKEHFKTRSNILIIFYNHGDKNSKQLKTMLNKDDWDKIFEFDERKVAKRTKFIHQVKLVKTLRSFQYDYIFSGDFGTINRLIIANSDYKKLYLVDDGVLTIRFHNTILNPNNKDYISISKKAKMLRYLLFGLHINIKGNINLFTCYNLTPHGNEVIEHNDYHYLQNKYLNNLKQDTQLYLLGQNFVNVNLFDTATYIRYIKKIINHYKTSIIYIPHRGETISDELKALCDDNFHLESSQGPVELRFLTQEKYPKHIVSFNTSALFTLEKIFSRTKIDSVYIEQSDCTKVNNRLKESYALFDNTNVNVVHL